MENIMKNKNVWQSLVIIFNAKSTFFSLRSALQNCLIKKKEIKKKCCKYSATTYPK